MTRRDADGLATPFFADVLADHGDAPALQTTTETMSYAQLAERVAAAAARLGARRRLVLVSAANSIDAIVGYLGALNGRHPVLLAAGDDPAAIHELIETYDPDIVVDGDVVERHRRPAHCLHPDLALLLSTSGSTGAPKLVRLSRHNLHSNAAAIATYLSMTAADRAITTLPMQYCYGLSVLNSHLHVGASVVLTHLSVVDACFWDLVRSCGVTSFAGVPHTFDLLDRIGFDAMDLPTLRYVTQAGGRMHPENVRRYAELGRERGWELVVMYGQTEATARIAYLPPRLARSHPEAIGVAVPGGTLTIAEPDDGGVGELVYRGPNVMLGYAEGPADLALGRSIHQLHTGDLGRRIGPGLIEVVGRRNRFIKPFGLRVDLDHLERIFADHDIPAACTGDEHQLVVGVTGGHTAQARSLLAERVRLPPSCIRVVEFDALPRLPTGKPDYQEVRAAGCADSCRAAAIADGANVVHQAFAEILAVEPEDHDTFVGLGGDSLSYVEMSVRLEEVLGTVPQDWPTRTIGQLAAAASRRRRHWWAPVETGVIIRAVAIVLIVGTHTGLWHHPGGAHALLALAGYNFARFQLTGGRMVSSIARVALPSMGWLAVVAALDDDFTWQHALLVNGLVGNRDARWAYWFVEALVYILAAVAALLALPALRRIERRHPFPAAAMVVAAGLAVRFDVVDLSVDHRIFRPWAVFWLFALGWAAARYTAWPHRALVSVTAALAVPGFFGDAHQETIVAGAVVLITWVATMPLPRVMVGVVARIGAASLYIYLTHFEVYPWVRDALGSTVATAASVLVGFAAWSAARRVAALYRRIAGQAGQPAPRRPSPRDSLRLNRGGQL